MIAIGLLFVRMLRDCFKSRQRLEAEILVLRHQNVLQQRVPRRVHLRWADRVLFIWLYRRCPRILGAITVVRPETVVRWRAVLVMLSSISSYCIGSCTDLIANTSGAGGLTQRRADGNGNKIQASAPGSEPIASARPKHTENSSAFSGATP